MAAPGHTVLHSLPNLISLARLPLAVLFLGSNTPWVQGLIIAAAGATDFFDGWLARRFQQRSRMGELLDPVTDKLFVFTVLLTLFVRQQIRAWEVVLLLLRDVYNSAAFALAKWRGWPLRFRARLSGKILTAFQILTLLAYTLLPTSARTLLAITVAASLYAIFDYTRAGLADLRRARAAG
jgi:CDP-diacylglycerol--glycerol-3-phosphate 3-phosphatidyltransferase/cardiolipin synthase